MGDIVRLLAHAFMMAAVAFGAESESRASVHEASSTKALDKNRPANPGGGGSRELAPPDAKWIASAPLKTKVGQLFIFGFMGHDLSRGLRESIARQKPGAIIVFGRNIKNARQLIDLNYRAQLAAIKHSGVPLLIAVDQEGGSVIRIRTSPPLPSALALGATGSPELVHEAGLHTGRLLKALGFNMNLAPVLDVADPRTDPFVGTRTFGKDPEHVSRMGGRFAGGLSEAGVLPTAKHFPGHGGVADTHKETPVKNASIDALTKVDLVPFASGFREVPDSAVMLAHIAYPKIDPSGVPATFSKPIVTQLLREKMGFDGLVITDDIEMAGAFVIKDPAERAVRAIEAGADLVMVAWNRRLQAKAVDAVYKAVRSGRISETRLNESLRRILTAKRRVSPATKISRPTAERLQLVMRSQELQKLSLDTLHKQFERSTVQLSGHEELRDAERPIFVFSSGQQFFESLRRNARNRSVRFYRLSNSRTFDINRVMRANPSAIGVIHVGGTQSAAYANKLEADNASRVIVVNSETSILLRDPKMFQHIVDVHFRHPELGMLTAKYLFGDKPTPISIARGDTHSGHRRPAREAVEVELTDAEVDAEFAP